MKVFEPYLVKIKDEKNREIMEGLLSWVMTNYPMLDKKIAWNQPHFVHNNTFIIAFTHAKQHISVVPEYKAIEVFKEDIKKSNYQSTNFIYKMKWQNPIDYDLLKRIIDYNMEDKKGLDTYWRK
ncbi:MAG TPA: iron chaperone [Acholeplasmataceae bacterium]|nr:iron chaperone [Acholeplasmataceae bacterium]